MKKIYSLKATLILSTFFSSIALANPHHLKRLTENPEQHFAQNRQQQHEQAIRNFLTIVWQQAGTQALQRQRM